MFSVNGNYIGSKKIIEKYKEEPLLIKDILTPKYLISKKEGLYLIDNGNYKGYFIFKYLDNNEIEVIYRGINVKVNAQTMHKINDSLNSINLINKKNEVHNIVIIGNKIILSNIRDKILTQFKVADVKKEFNLVSLNNGNYIIRNKDADRNIDNLELSFGSYYYKKLLTIVNLQDKSQKDGINLNLIKFGKRYGNYSDDCGLDNSEMYIYKENEQINLLIFSRDKKMNGIFKILSKDIIELPNFDLTENFNWFDNTSIILLNDNGILMMNGVHNNNLSVKTLYYLNKMSETYYSNTFLGEKTKFENLLVDNKDMRFEKENKILISDNEIYLKKISPNKLEAKYMYNINDNFLDNEKISLNDIYYKLSRENIKESLSRVKLEDGIYNVSSYNQYNNDDVEEEGIINIIENNLEYKSNKLIKIDDGCYINNNYKIEYYVVKNDLSVNFFVIFDNIKSHKFPKFMKQDNFQQLINKDDKYDTCDECVCSNNNDIHVFVTISFLLATIITIFIFFIRTTYVNQ